MKKLLLCMLLATSFVACKNEETKKAEDAVKDKDTGTWTSLKPMLKMIQVSFMKSWQIL
jgi:hypothetical protein